MPPDQWTILPSFLFQLDVLAAHAGMAVDVVERVVSAFAVSDDERNEGFRSLQDFNWVNATPCLRWGDRTFALFQYYSLAEAIYETPFYWMGDDKGYVAKARTHRGKFTEAFARQRLEQVFGPAHVHADVIVSRKKGERVSDIDVFVLFGDRALVVQAKSKKLTLKARKGDNQQLEDDFKKAVQEAYDQAYACSAALAGASCRLENAQGQTLELITPLKAIFPICIVADHYPALSFQADQFLAITTTETILPPLVTDVFALDTMAEMLETPLAFLSYLDLRARFGKKFVVSHELSLLAFHLRRNLWPDDEFDSVALGDDTAIHLDIAMAARRDGQPGARTPEGVLTRRKNTTLGRIIMDIEARPDPAIIDLGLLLYQLHEDAWTTFCRCIDKIAALSRKDGLHHDFAGAFSIASSGITVHANYDPDPVAAARLQSLCEMRKYAEKASSWFGLVIDPATQKLRFSLSLAYPWKHDPWMEEATRQLRAGVQPSPFMFQQSKPKKPGRNDPCFCGSGRKYKKCHMP